MIVSGQMKVQSPANKDLASLESKLPAPTLIEKLESIFLYYCKAKLPQTVKVDSFGQIQDQEFKMSLKQFMLFHQQMLARKNLKVDKQVVLGAYKKAKGADQLMAFEQFKDCLRIIADANYRPDKRALRNQIREEDQKEVTEDLLEKLLSEFLNLEALTIQEIGSEFGLQIPDH